MRAQVIGRYDADQADRAHIKGRRDHEQPFVEFSPGLALATASTVAGALGAATDHKKFTFEMIPSPGIQNCLPDANGHVTIEPGLLNDKMKVEVKGLHTNAAASSLMMVRGGG